jgi:hypothetical protein
MRRNGLGAVSGKKVPRSPNGFEAKCGDTQHRFTPVFSGKTNPPITRKHFFLKREPTTIAHQA